MAPALGLGVLLGLLGLLGAPGRATKVLHPRRFLKGGPRGFQRAPGGSQRGSRAIQANSREFPFSEPLPPPRSLGLLRFRVPTCETAICPVTGDVTGESGCHWSAGNSGANGGAGGGAGGGARAGRGRAGPSGAERSSAMAPAPALGVLLGLLGLLATPGRATKVLHSLRYLHVAVSEPGPGVPQFVEMGFVDGIPFVRYDSERGRMEPLTPWMEREPEPGYWDGETERCKRNQQIDVIDLETLRARYNQSGGLHTVQWVAGCDLLSDRSVRGSRRDGYDGRDFMSFELGSQGFVPADSAAQVTTRRWNGDGVTVEQLTNYLEHICPEWLEKYVGYGREALERKEPPDVHVSGKEEFGTLILSCHAYGFYPRPIAVSWMKGDEIRDQETEWGEVVPNSDGTFHTWARIEARPEEREQYRCRVEHSGMPEPGIFALEPESGGNLTAVVAVSIIVVIVILVLLVGFIVWKFQSGRRQKHGYSPPAGKNMGTNGSTAVQITA